MDGAPTRKITEVVNKCPTQALIWKNNQDLTEEELIAQRHVEPTEETPRTLTGPKETTTIRIMRDGPIVVEGKFTILDGNDQELKPTTMTSFCRCGASLNMPYCDGTHRKIDFMDQLPENGE